MYDPGDVWRMRYGQVVEPDLWTPAVRITEQTLWVHHF
jgi:hypothetical protein